MNTSLRTGSMLVLVGLVIVLLVPTVWADNCHKPKDHQKSPAVKTGALQPQSTCPVSGSTIDKSAFVDVAGYRIYACCPGCLAQIEADPKKAVVTLAARGEKPESRLVVCTKCGELRGSKSCCSPDAAKCGKCGLNKDSIGCCRDLKALGGDKEVVLCHKCGEFMGTKACCKPGAKKCGGCGLTKGSPGCCKPGAYSTQKSD